MRALDLYILHHAVTFLLILVLIVLAIYPLQAVVQADKLSTRSLRLDASSAGVTTNYTLAVTITNPASIGSLKLLFCANDPLEQDSCDVPVGMDASHATLAAQGGLGDFALLSQTANSLVLSRTPSVIQPPQNVSLTFSGVVNPAASGSYYGRLSTYASTNASGNSVDFSGLAFAINDALQLSAKVPPYLTFCSGVTISGTDCSQVTGDYLNLGTLSANHSSSASSQLVVATNAADGYGVQVAGTTLTSGNNVIQNLVTPELARAGTAQFGLNLRANHTPAVGADPTGPGNGTASNAYNIVDKYVFNPDDTIAGGSQPDDYRKYTISYVVNVSASQPAGTYTSTLTYVAVANF